MENKNFYEEFNNIEESKHSINFTSKSRRFFEKYIGLPLSRTGYFFKKIGKKFKDKYVLEESNVREVTIDEKSIVNDKTEIIDQNKELFNKNVKLAHLIDKLIKDNKDVDLNEELSILEKTVYELKTANDNNDYKKLNDIETKLNNLNTKVLTKIENEKLYKTEDKNPFVMNNIKEDKKETEVKLKPIETKKEVMPIIVEEKTPIVKPVEIKALIVKEPVIKKSNDIIKIKSKLSLFDRKISAIESKVILYKESLSEVIRNITKIDKILNEDNLDSREIKMYKELRDEKIIELNTAKAKVDEAKRELEAAKAEKSLYKQSIIEIDVPQKNGEVYKKRVTVNDLLEKKEREEKLAKAKKEQIKREKLWSEGWIKNTGKVIIAKR